MLNLWKKETLTLPRSWADTTTPLGLSTGSFITEGSLGLHCGRLETKKQQSSYCREEGRPGRENEQTVLLYAVFSAQAERPELKHKEQELAKVNARSAEAEDVVRGGGVNRRGW